MDFGGSEKMCELVPTAKSSVRQLRTVIPCERLHRTHHVDDRTVESIRRLLAESLVGGSWIVPREALSPHGALRNDDDPRAAAVYTAVQLSAFLLGPIWSSLDGVSLPARVFDVPSWQLMHSFACFVRPFCVFIILMYVLYVCTFSLLLLFNYVYPFPALAAVAPHRFKLSLFATTVWSPVLLLFCVCCLHSRLLS